jgi:hypothetical protein
MPPSDFAPGTFGCHEALHVTDIMADMVERYVVEHPSIKQNPDWLALAETASVALAKLYQAIGEAHL